MIAYLVAPSDKTWTSSHASTVGTMTSQCIAQKHRLNIYKPYATSYQPRPEACPRPQSSRHVTSSWRRTDVNATLWRRVNAGATLLRRRVTAGTGRICQWIRFPTTKLKVIINSQMSMHFSTGKTGNLSHCHMILYLHLYRAGMFSRILSMISQILRTIFTLRWSKRIKITFHGY